MLTLRKRLLEISLSLIAAALICCPSNAGTGGVVRLDDGQMSRQLNMPVSIWKQPDKRPSGVILAIHGLSLHATTYDACARYLAARGMVVAAPDLRGYGSWWQDHRSPTAEYGTSENDLAAVARALRSKYKDVPLIVVGESLGGTLAIRLAANHPELVDGLILSAPALKHRHHLPLKTLTSAALAVAHRNCGVDVSGYIKNYFSEDPVYGRETLADPLVRKTLTWSEIISSCRTIAGTAACISEIPTDMPVLIMQGQDDAMISRSSISMLCARLRTHSACVCVFPNRGHILLETARVKAETLQTVSAWLFQNLKLRTGDTKLAIAGFAGSR